MSTAGWLLAGALVLVVLIVLEGKRQERIYGKSERGSLMRAGLLEIQRQLEPERRVEMLVEERDETEQAEAGEGFPPQAR